MGGTRHVELAQRLARRGHRVTIITSQINYFSGKRLGEKRWISREREQGLEIVRCWTLNAIHRSMLWRAISMITFALVALVAALRIDKVDLVFGTSPPMFQLPTAYLAARLRRKPLIIEIRDLWPDFAVAMGVLTNAWLIALAQWAERFFYRSADWLVINSPGFHDHVVGRGAREQRLSIIPNGVDPTAFHPGERAEGVRTAWGVGERFTAVYAGAFGPANNLMTVVEAAEHLRDDDQIRLVLVGDGMERKKLADAITQRGLTNIRLAAAVPKKDVGKVLAAADCCIATLRDTVWFRTVYPNKVFDYLAAGRPVVLNIDGVIRQVVEEAGAGVYVPAADGKALAAAIRHLADDPEMARRMGAAGRDHVARRFSRDDQALALAEICESLAT